MNQLERLSLTNKDIVRAVCFAGGSFLLAALLSPFGATTALGGVITGSVATLFLFQLSVFRKILAKLNKNRSELEAVISINAAIKPRVPLPPLHDWAIAPEAVQMLTQFAHQSRPNLIVECGSGLSTLLFAYALQQIGHGEIISLEHDAEYVKKNNQLLEIHGLADVAKIIHAPLKTVSLREQNWQWYDTGVLSLDKPIDILFIDGPPGPLQELSRYPALPFFSKHLSQKALVILDDAARPDEQQITSLWCRENDDLKLCTDIYCDRIAVFQK